MAATMPETDLTRLVTAWRAEAERMQEDGDRISAQQVYYRAEVLEETIREMLRPTIDPEAVAQHEVDVDRARKRIDNADSLNTYSTPAAVRQVAAELLADVWDLGTDLGIKPTDWGTVALPTLVLQVVGLAENRKANKR